ncbi:asparagine synthetase B family protein [Candidatus Viridilinea mediisalina]|uniref:asparagine synthase (glutamine-hydrolyzing) n=1 Tax=Candidatus Viridilinea mediisalina TaxID=2024553 RepID=A0A2A6RE66_9CHLR|nr:asparagine synthase-related protein [Candidatus Viridilinea mediisalina]PDW00621.1 asparagine synthase [Candidatus Viridilinea mediisalina]
MRFFATLNAPEPQATLVQVGATPALVAPPCALGLVADARPWLAAGPYRYANLVAVGEVTLFNRAELLAALDASPLLPTCSDGELLLATYATFGPAGLGRADGLFALAIWDGTCLMLARDPVGGRTLFYSQVGSVWVAASHLMALRRSPIVTPRLNLSAVQSFLTFAYLPGAETLLEGVFELLPGQYLRLTPGGQRNSGFAWLPQELPPDPHMAEADYVVLLRQQLEAATQAMLPPNDDVGVLLSGGVDSSLVAALAARFHAHPPRTYSISFGDELPNELAYSGLVANHCATRHRVLRFRGAQVAAALPDAVAALDCPVGDPLTAPNLLLARTAAADGLRVILNGEGGDPCFGGPKNLPLLAYALQHGLTDPAALARIYLRSYRKCYDELPRLFTPAVHAALRSAPPLEERVQPYLSNPHMQSYLNRLLYTNVRTKGAHHILTKVERITAACGLEGRAPLFSRAIVATSFALPPQLKLRGTCEKWILKQAVADLLPAQIIERPKSGMRVPVQHWLHGPLHDLAHDLLLGPRARARGLFNPALIQTWLEGHGMLWPRQGIALWMLVTLELWLRAYRV